MSQERVDHIRQLIAPVLEREKVELFDLSVRRHGPVFHVGILVDNPQGGITVDACVRMNHEIDRLLEQERVFDAGYTLELSSPGADRPLQTKKDFLRVMHKKVRIVMKEPVARDREVTGDVVEVTDDAVAVMSAQGVRHVPLEKIQQAEQYL